MATRSTPIFDRFYLTHFRGLRKFVSRRTAGLDVEDVTQEAFLRVFEAAKQDESVLTRNFLTTVTRNLVIDRSRKLRIRREPAQKDELAAQVVDETADIESACLLAQRKALIKRALSEMSPTRRQVFMLRKYEGLSQHQVAEKMGLSVSSIEKHVMAVMATLRDLARTEGIGDAGQTEASPVSRKVAND